MGRKLSIDEAAKAMTLSRRTLERLRQEGTGPMFVRISRQRIAYDEDDIQAYLNNRKFKSTSEYGRG